ncbi:crotonase/enoyl-CoA hydratase family protein [Candidatus Binatia bacterium]|nr:crotonase/enoyl-CoA hydratase family protein [Candidatus Binatia bacterium]
MGDRTKLEIAGGVAWLTLDDGKVNALSTEMLAEIAAALDAAQSAGAVVVLRGRDGMFSAGFDLKTFKKGPAETVEMLRAGADVIVRLLGFPRPVLSLCTGHAYPAGAFLIMSSDVRLCVDGPWRIGMNEVAIGLTLPYFAIELARHRLTPPGFARLTTGALFPPDEARHFGYVDRIVAPGAAEDAVRAEVERLLALDMPSFVATKARVNEQAIRAIRDAVDGELKSVAA